MVRRRQARKVPRRGRDEDHRPGSRKCTEQLRKAMPDAEAFRYPVDDIWQSVTCRPGNGGLLSGVKRPIIAQTIATARRCDPIKDHTIASVVPPIGLRPHSGTALATLSHPD